MASVVTQNLFSSTKKFALRPFLFGIIGRNSAVTPKKKQKRGTIKHRNLIASDCQFLADRGYLRSQKPYAPPPDASSKIQKLAVECFGSDYQLTDVLSKTLKFEFLDKCWKTFQFSIPNSQLHNIKTINDVLVFYTTPIETTTPYEDLLKMDLPPNLHVQEHYVRFNDGTHPYLDGITAFPESPTVVTGLKYRKKYKGHETNLPEYYYNDGWYERST